jgi:hypothetical protein
MASMLKRFTRKPGPFFLSSPPLHDAKGQPALGPLSDGMTLDDESKLSNLAAPPVKVLSGSPTSSLYSFEELLSSDTSSSNVDKELPALPSPTISTISSIPDSVLPYSTFAPSARLYASVVIPGSLARPDSATLPLTAANLDLFFPSSGSTDDFYLPQDHEDDMPRNSAARDRVQAWVESRSLSFTSLGDPEAPESLDSNGADHGVLPTDYPIIMDTDDGDNAALSSTRQPEFGSPRRPLHPDLQFRSTSAPMEQPTSSAEPGRLSFPMSVGHSDAPSPAFPTYGLPFRAVPDDMLSQISEREPSFAESPSKIYSPPLSPALAFVRPREPQSNYLLERIPEPIDTAVVPIVASGTSEQHKNLSPFAIAASVTSQSALDAPSAPISAPKTSPASDGTPKQPATPGWMSDPPSVGNVSPDQAAAPTIEPSLRRAESGPKSVGHTSAGLQGVSKPASSVLSEEGMSEDDVNRATSPCASTFGRGRLVLSMASMSVKSMRTANYDNPVIPSTVEGSVMSRTPPPAPSIATSEDTDSVVVQRSVDQTPVVSPSWLRSPQLDPEPHALPQFDHWQALRTRDVTEPVSLGENDVHMVPPASAAPAISAARDDNLQVDTSPAPPHPWRSPPPDHAPLYTHVMSPISECASGLPASVSETEQHEDEGVDDGASVESKPLPSTPVESPRGASMITLRSVSPFVDGPLLEGEVGVEGVPAVLQQEDGAQESPQSSDSASTVRLPRVMQAPPLARDGASAVEEAIAQPLRHATAVPLDRAGALPMDQAGGLSLDQTGAPPTVGVGQLVSGIHDLSGRCVDGILELIKVMCFSMMRSTSVLY